MLKHQNGKIFGIGLPRTGTTSVAMAMMELGYKTCHVCYDESLYEQCDAFFDTPFYVDYPILDQRYPGSKFILTWRDPQAWLISFQKNLMPYFSSLNEENIKGNMIKEHFWRYYTAVFGRPETLAPYILLLRYERHRTEVERYFRYRSEDLLVLNIDKKDFDWDVLCRFLNKPRPLTPFPYINRDEVYAWDRVEHENKIPTELAP